MSIESKHAYRFEYLKSEKWQTVRLDALVREGGKCQICGEESISNDAHHIWYPDSIWDTTQDNLVILCRACHEFLHAMMPECKTKDESIGRENWIRFRNAIEMWRIRKQPVFDSGIDAPIRVKDLRLAYEALKQKVRELQAEKVNAPETAEAKAAFIIKTVSEWSKLAGEEKPSK